MKCLEENTLDALTRGELSSEGARDAIRHADECAVCRVTIAATAAGLGPAAEVAPQPRLLGGKYQLGRVLGSGGMGTVFEAVNMWTGRRVAIKLLHGNLSQNREVTERFLREAQSSTRVAHRNIVDVLDLGQEPDGTLYMVQELLTGETLGERLSARGKLPIAEALSIVMPVVDALVAAHGAGVLHRDIKPENVFLTADGVKLIDFGISKLTDNSDALLLTERGGMLGTPLYMSPEQLTGETAVDARTDVWSLGVVLFELVAGQRPFAGKSFSVVAANILQAPLPRLRAIAPDVEPRFARVVERAMARDREHRFATMRELRDALQECRATTAPVARSGRVVVLAGLGGAALLAAAVAGLVRGSKPAPRGRSSASAAFAASVPVPAAAPVPAPPSPPSAGVVPLAPAASTATPERRRRARVAHPPLTQGAQLAPAATPAVESPPTPPSIGTNQAPILDE